MKSHHLPATWMELKIVILSEISQKEKDKYCISVYITYMFIIAQFTIAKKHGMNLNVHQQMNGLRRCGTYTHP